MLLKHLLIHRIRLETLHFFFFFLPQPAGFGRVHVQRVCLPKHVTTPPNAPSFSLQLGDLYFYSVHALLSNQSELHPFPIAWQLLAGYGSYTKGEQCPVQQYHLCRSASGCVTVKHNSTFSVGCVGTWLPIIQLQIQ